MVDECGNGDDVDKRSKVIKVVIKPVHGVDDIAVIMVVMVRTSMMFKFFMNSPSSPDVNMTPVRSPKPFIFPIATDIS